MRPYIAVAGASNIDIGGRSCAPLVPMDSNPGEVFLSRGGVGFNIASGLAAHGAPVKLLTAFGDDILARLFTAREAGGRGLPRPSQEDGAPALCGGIAKDLDLSHAVVVPQARTGLYVYILEPDGAMRVAVNDTKVVEAIGETYLQSKIDVLNGAEFVIIEANLTAEAIKTIASIVKKPIWADPVSTLKASRLEAAFPSIALLKPNLAELACLSGEEISSPGGFVHACQVLLGKGIGALLVSLGKDGAVYCDSSGLRHCPAKAVEAGDSTGAGDSLLAGFAYARHVGKSIEESLLDAVAEGARAVSRTAPGSRIDLKEVL